MITQVKEFNHQAMERYNKAVQAWKQSENNPYPNIAFYLFYTPDGNERQRGYVVTIRPDSYHFYSNYKEALEATN